MDSLGRNITLPIYNADGTSFHGLELKKFTFDSVVMALGDKITGELYYTSNTLSVNQTEYVVYDGVKYYLINPPTIVKEGMKADNGTAKGMTKYSFTFYHPMFMLYNFPFTDVAVTSGEEKYKSQDKNFFWIGNLVDYVAKLNKNLSGTEWIVEIGSNVPVQDKNKLSEVLSFNDQKIADALKTGYDTWEIPYIIDIIASTDSRYEQGKRFLIRYGLPSQEILVENAQHQLVPYVFQMGQGVGLKNDSRTPKNNKIVTRIAGYGSEDNIPFGYPQILWTGNQTWNYTINNSASAPNSYPIYDGIVAGQRVRLIHHPFTRSHLMPTIYADTVNKKVNPYASGYDPTIEIKDYYDAVNDSSWTYPNQIIPYAPSYEIHEFSDIKPELGEKHIVSAEAFDGDAEKKYLTLSEGLDQLMKLSSETNIDVERGVIKLIHDKVESGTSGSGHQEDMRYVFKWSVDVTTDFIYVKFASSNINFEMEIHRTNSFPSAPWNDAMDDDGNYKQSYFNITLPQLDFDIYACAAVTQEMKINMRSGACLGCSFPVEVDWEDYKANFYDSDGNFAPTGSQRDYNKYPDSSAGAITIICKKEIDTFGTLMPNIYQQPKANDKFVILGISLPTSYITNAQLRLDHDMCKYMLDNNVHYFEWPLKFDEFFLANHTNILAQMKPNILVRFNFASEQHELYIKQISVKYGEKPLPQYSITLTDDIEIVLSPIGRVTDEVSSLRVLFGGGGSGSGDVNLDLLSEYFLSKQNDDTAAGMIRFLRGLQVGENFVTGLLGEGGIFRVDDDGTTYIEADKLYIRMRAYFDTVEVKKYLHSGGNRIASKAGVNCSRVEWIDANGEVTNVLEDTVKFRCYFRANGENGREITNDFVVNDLAFCKETNVDNTSIQQHGYWRCVIGVSSSPNDVGEHWIDLSKSDCQSGSNIPLAQDDIIQLGHKTDNTRQGAIVEFVGGEDAPSYQIYQGINSYNLTGKNYVRFGYDSQNHSAQAYIGNPDGSTYLWYHYVTEGGQTLPRLDIKANVQFTSPITHQDTTIEDFAMNVTQSIDDLQAQIDGEVDTWFYEGTPTLNNAPANGWTDTEKERHLGDLYYDIGTGATGGFAYRFIKTESGGTTTYSWQYIDDTAITEALAKAADAYDLADHKRRVFICDDSHHVPTPPYDEGDLWVNVIYPYTGEPDAGSVYNNEILKCINTKASGGNFNINDWTRSNGYMAALQAFVTGTYAQFVTNIQQQVDKKAETWYQDEDPSKEPKLPDDWPHWTDSKANHVGDIWYCTADNDPEHGKNTTWIYKERINQQGELDYYWAQEEVPKEVFDTIDGKAEIFVGDTPPSTYCKFDMWIIGDKANTNDIPVGCQKKDIVVASEMPSGVTKRVDDYEKGDWAKKDRYTDDTELNNFKLNQYVQALTSGNISLDITNASNAAQQAKQAADDAQADADAANTRLNNWADDGKISPTEKTALKQQWEDIKKEYLQICADATRYNVSTTNFETAYTNANNAFTKYTASNPENIAIEADYANIAAYYSARQTILDSIASAAKTYAGGYYNDTVLSAIKTALGSALGASTLIDGGLMLTSMIVLRQLKKNGSGMPLDPTNINNYTTWAGVSGEYNDKTQSQTGWAKGNGIAAWYGGDMIDFEMLTSSQQSAGWGTGTNQYRYAKSLFRFDGTGYLAGGNLTWDTSGTLKIGKTANSYNIQFNSDGSGSVAAGNISWTTGGVLTIQGNSITAVTELKVAGSDVLTQTTADARYVTIDWFRSLFRAYNSSNTELTPNNSTTGLASIKAMVGLWAESYLSALGQSSGGGGGGSISLNQPLADINQAGLAQLTTTSDAGKTVVFNGSTWVYSTATTLKANAMNVSSTLTVGSAISTGGIVYAVGVSANSSYGFQIANLANSENYVLLANGGTKLLSEIGGGGDVSSITVGTTNYTPTNGIVTLPDYLPMTGGTLTLSGVNSFTVRRNDADYTNTFIRFQGKIDGTDNTTMGYLGFSAKDTPSYRTSGGGNRTLWHSGNFNPEGYVTTSALNTTLGNYALSANVYSKTDADNRFLRLADYTSLGASDTNTVNLNTITTLGTYRQNGDGSVQYISNKPDGITKSFKLIVEQMAYNNASYIRQTIQQRSSNAKFSRYTNNDGTDWSSWVLVQENLSNYLQSSDLNTALGDYVTLAGAEIISGVKTFTSGMLVKSSSTTNNIPNSVLNFAYGNNAGGSIYADSSARLHIDSASGENLYFGYGSSAASSTSGTLALVLTDTSFKPLNVTTGVFDLGTSSGRWKGIYGQTIDLTGNASVDGGLSVTGNSTIRGTLGVTGTTTLSASLDVTGDTRLHGNMYLDNSESIYCKNAITSDVATATDNAILSLNSSNYLYIGYGIRTMTNSRTNIYGGTGGVRIMTNGTTSRMYINSTGNVSIGSTTTTFITEKLNVNGNVRIGDAVLVWDSTNGALKVQKSDGTAANFYATGAVSALGASSSGTTYLDQATADARYLKLSGGQTMTGSFTGTSITLSTQMKSTNAVASAYMTVGTGTLNTSYNLYVSGNANIANLAISSTSSGGSTTNTLTSSGVLKLTAGSITINATQFTGNCAYTGSSDMRKKIVIGNAGASIVQIADAPIFNFRWKDVPNGRTMLGSSAQYWQTIFPCAVVTDIEGYLSQDYAGIALAAAVITARTVQTHEERIAALEAENARLQKELNELKAA